MRIDGPNPSIGSDYNPQGSTYTTEEQITDALNVPVRAHDHEAANARRDSVREIFEKLSPDEAKELFSRLAKYNHRDALSEKFYGTFSDVTIESLKKTLKSRFEQADAGAAQTGGSKQPEKTGGTAKKSEVDIAGQTRARDLNDQLKSKASDTLLKIASRKDLDLNGKKEAIHEWIRTSSAGEYQKMIEQSGSWPKDVQNLVDDVIANGGFGGFASRLLTDLNPKQQIEMLKRLHSGNHQSAVGTLVGGADPAVLNQIAADFKSYPGFELDSNKNRASGSILGVLAMRARDLTPDNQRKLADTLINDGMPQQPLTGARSLFLADMFDSLNEKQSRDLFAYIQGKGDLKKMLANFQGDPINFQKEFLGLGRKEIKAVKEAFESLAAEQPKGSDLEKIYSENARQAANWM
jgi:hypothetical protein